MFLHDHLRSSLSCFTSVGFASLLAAALNASGAEPSEASPANEKQTEANKSAEAENGVSLFSEDDGWLDISEFIDQAYGFIPLAIPITEPAVGYGGALGLVFVDREEPEAGAAPGRPNLTFVGGMQTENDTKGVFAADSRYWLDNSLQSLAGGFDMSVNLDYHGIGSDPSLAENPQRYNISAEGAFLLGRYRLGRSNSWLGLGYLRADTQLQFARQSDQPEPPQFNFDNQLAGLVPEYTYDSRDSIFTPNKGYYFSSSAIVFSPELGGDEEFERLSLFTMGFWPVAKTVTLSAVAGAVYTSEETPIYMRPFIQLRGAPAMRYQGEYAGQIEAELRWQFWQRFSAVAFAGRGTAGNKFAERERTQDIDTEGLGFRYEMARKYQLHMGIDAAHGPDGMAYYLVVGSAWLRP
ncbi:MAG TPA: BamA/TamA family outer membrane protein [Cellvibrio sp.]|nr:BamA/TamA family outer membrane protein [Cellvibrio sp.]